MSVRVSGKVWELELDPTEKLIALALAEYANHEGNNIRPGNALLCAMTGLSQPTVSAKITKFMELGLLRTDDETVGGRGQVRQFSMDTDAIDRRPYFIEKEERKLKARHRFQEQQTNKQALGNDVETNKQLLGIQEQNLKADSENLKADSENLKADTFAYKEENRHEPSEPLSILEPSAPRNCAQKPSNEFYETFKTAFAEKCGSPYQNKKADFVQLANLRKQMGDWLTAERWLQAIGNYFSSELGTYTLADLAARFNTFFRAPIDRFGKCVLPPSTAFSTKTQGNLAAARVFLERHGFTLEDAA